MADPLEHPLLTTMGLLAEAYTGLARKLEVRLEHEAELSVQWFEVLLRLGRSPDQRLRMSDLAAQTTLSPSGLTRAVDRLEAAGLVARKPCDTDRRSAWATLTPAGAARLDKAVPMHVEQLSEILESVYAPEQLESFSELVRQLRDAVSPCAGRAGVDR